MAKAAISWIGEDSDSELITGTDNLIDGVTTHPTEFPILKVDPTMAALGTLRTNFSGALSAAMGGGEAETAIKNSVRSLLEDGLRDSCANIQKLANNDRATMLLGGCPVQKEPAPAGDVTPPENVRLARGGNSGELDARANRVGNAHSYEWRYATAAAPTAWQDGGTSIGARKTLVGLTPGTVYTVQVRAVGTSGRSDWSDPAVLMVV
jgi:hypothetical protein